VLTAPSGNPRRRREYLQNRSGRLPLVGDDPEELSQSQQDRENDDEHHQAGEQATRHVPLAPQQALDLRDDQPAREEAVEEHAEGQDAQPQALDLDGVGQRLRLSTRSRTE
jgi:hypothetical protein